MTTKAIKMPQGAAAEYAKYSCNFFKGCSNACTYCFNRRWGWGDIPTLKKCFKDEEHAMNVFRKELKDNLPELQKHGVFFSFTTDPMLPETRNLTADAVLAVWKAAWLNNIIIPVKILTKRADWIDGFFTNNSEDALFGLKMFTAFGFTITGRDDLETGASTNSERIEAMRKLHEDGFKTFASIEPIIDFVSSAEMMRRTSGFCDLYKVGLMSGKKYDKWECEKFVNYCCNEFENAKIYFKDSLLATAGISREELPANCVGRDYNMFNH